MPEGWVVPLLPGNGAQYGTLLVDGFVRGEWKLVRDGTTAAIAVEPLSRLSKRDAAAVASEGRRLLGFLAPDAEAREVRAS